MEAEQRIASQLDAGEQLLWSGQPAHGIRFRRGDIFMIPFSLMWGGFAIFWELMALRKSGSIFFQIWGVPFVLVGLYLMVGRFCWDAWRRTYTFYGVTNRRVLLITGFRSQSTSTVPLRAIPAITLSERRDGSGDVVFDTNDGRHVATGGFVSRGSSVPVMLEFILNAREVYDIIRKAQQAAV
jgi:PH (Pleckstrin Homology) domain-containing protein